MSVTRSDAATLLALVQAFDHRNVAEADVMAWADALHDLEPQDCAEAIRSYFRDSSEWLMPSHIRQRVKALRDTRATREAQDARRREAIEAPRDPNESHEGYLAVSQVLSEWQAANRPRSAEYDQGAADADDAARKVPCLWCKARPGQRCTVPNVQPPRQISRSHPARYESAMEATR